MSDEKTFNTLDNRLMLRFDRIAGSYDSGKYLSRSGLFFNELEANIVEELAQGGCGTRGLDIPCGTGRLTRSLANCCEEVIAVDLSKEMLSVAKEKLHGTGVVNIVFMRVNGRKLCFPENTFHTIVCFNFLHMIPNDQKGEFMVEFARVLNPGGKLIIEFISPFYGLFLSLFRYRKRLRAIPSKCYFPGQDHWLFRGYQKKSVIGIGFPFFPFLSRIFGNGLMIKMSRDLGKIPLLQYLGYSIIFELYNEKHN